VADEVHSLGAGGCLREAAFGEAADFVGAGLDPFSGVGAVAELFILKRGTGGWVNDSVGGVRKWFKLRSQIGGMELGCDSTGRLLTRTVTGVVLVLRGRGTSGCLVL
jgi:hypothetical protein